MQTYAAHAEMLQLVTFRLAGQKYAVDILKVQEINNMKEITKIPNSPNYLEGAVNLRGKVIPVLNLRKKFGMDLKGIDDNSKIVVMNVRGIVTGILVDSVSEVLRVPVDVVEPPPPVSSALNKEFIQGIAKLEDGLVVLLDIDELLSSAEHSAVFGNARRR